MRTKLVDNQVVELTAEENLARDLEEQKWADASFDRAILQLRQERNQKLAITDWRALSDQILSQDWLDYRQSLRDLTQNLETVEDVNSVVWPSPPE
tara:strand:+ start:454 stop:741 length:288 start_codon:yes stop_codon:yes gene_type:complete